MDSPTILAVFHTMYEIKSIDAEQFLLAVSDVMEKSTSIVPFTEKHRRLIDQARKEIETKKLSAENPSPGSEHGKR